MDTNNLSHLAKIISDLANSNLEQLQGKCQDEKDMQDYYLGILQKQALLLLDLSTILKNRQSKYISTPYIILIPTPTQVTQDYHHQKHKQIIGQRYLGWMSLGGCQKFLHSLLLLKLLCLLLYQISG